LLAGYDIDPIAALTAALRIVLDMPDAGWAALIAAAPIDANRRGRLLSHEVSSLDQLAVELNEFRSIDTSHH
jgi:hypothetical protein